MQTYYQKQISVTITKDFKKVYDEIVKVVQNDKDFKELLANTKNKSIYNPEKKRVQVEGLIVRYVLGSWIQQNRARIVQQEKEELLNFKAEVKLDAA